MELQQSVFENGLKVVTVRMPGRDSVSLGIWIRAGARHEPESEAGISHVLEHMLFKGTRRRSARQIKEEIEGTGGVLNAFTAEETTCYFAKTLRSRYPKAMEVLADMVHTATLPEDELKKEKAVILEEIRMVKDVPSDLVDDMIGELMWPGHPLGRPIAGTEVSVSALKRRHLVRYKQKTYHAGNIVVAAAGPVFHEDVVELARQAFPGRGGKAVPPPRPYKGARSGPRLKIVEKATEQTHFVVGVHGFSRYHPDRYKLALLSLILGGNMSSRLFEELREKRGLAYDIRSGTAFYKETGAVLISAGVESRKAVPALHQIFRELSKLRNVSVGRLELRRAKDFFLGQLQLGLEDTLDTMLWIGEAAVYREQIPVPELIRREIESVDERALRITAQALFARERMHLAMIGPLTAAEKRKIRALVEDDKGI